MNADSHSTPKPPASVWERSTIVRILGWLCSWHGVRQILIVTAWVVTIVCLWYGEENWRGRRAWNHYRDAVQARGESLDFTSFVPKPVADSDNFATTPFLASFIAHRDREILTNDLYARGVNSISDAKLSKDKGHRHFMDLPAWKMASDALEKGPLPRGKEFETDDTTPADRAAAAPAIIEGLKPDKAAFEELRGASGREFSRYAVNYDVENPWAILLPHLARVKQVCKRLELEACAYLASGQPEPALADVELSLSVGDSVKTDPFLISMLVRDACMQIAIQPVWEGLAEHTWTDPQLRELEERFLAYNFLADWKRPLLSERACGIMTADLAKNKGLAFLQRTLDPNASLQDGLTFVACKLMPSGWYDREKANYGILFDIQNEGVIDPGAHLVSPSRVAANVAAIDPLIQNVKGAFFGHRFIAAMLLPSLHNIDFRVAAVQAASDEAAIACALERYRLAKGEFPEKLELLSPEFIARLPNDVITGDPYKYRHESNGRFVLYSVGWDQKDDGGATGKNGLFDQQGDWVWQ